MRVDFYHLTAAPLERVLPAICEKLLAGGGRLLVVAGAEQAEVLDRQLWTSPADGFLPHAQAGKGRDEAQPVLISDRPDPANGARNIALADGRWRDEALGFQRAFLFFGADTVDGARASWRALAKAEGVERHYWKQDENGRWSELG